MKEAFLQKCRDYRRHYVESRTFDNDQDVPADSTQDQCQEEEDFVDPPVKNREQISLTFCSKINLNFHVP